MLPQGTKEIVFCTIIMTIRYRRNFYPFNVMQFTMLDRLQMYVCEELPLKIRQLI